MPFPIVFTSSAPAGGRPSADFSGPVLLGKLSDAGPVGTGPVPQPSGTLYVQSTGTQNNQILSTGAISKYSLPYIPVTTGTLVGSVTAPPFVGFGAGVVLAGVSTQPHLEVWSSLALDWVQITALSTGSGSGLTGGGTAGTLAIWTSTGILGDSVVRQGSNTITISSSGGAQTVQSGPGLGLTLQGGNAATTGGGTVGGNVKILGGASNGVNTGGAATVQSGGGTLAGAVALIGGNATGGNGGDITLDGGDGSGTGGDLFLTGGDGVASRGGNIELVTGGGTVRGSMTFDVGNTDIVLSTISAVVQTVTLEMLSTYITMTNLPSTNPVVAGALWISTTSRFLTVSSG